MAIPSVVQGLIEAEGGKVFELDSPIGAAWLESIGSFRFESTGDSKACTVRREPSGYWYGCRKVAGKVRKKYIGKSSEISIVKLEEIAAALEVPPVPRANKVAEVAQEVAQNTRVVEKVAEVAQEVAENRLTALELEVANLRKAFELLLDRLPGKSELVDSVELPKINKAVAEELQNELSNLKVENEYLRQKLAESRDTVETLNWGTEALNEQLATANQTIAERSEKIESLKQELAENTRYYTARLNEAGATVSTFKDKLEAAQAKNQRLQNELSNLRAENEALKAGLETLRQSLAKSDTVINLRNQEIAALNSRLAAKDEIIAETGEQFNRLDQEVAQMRSQLEAERADQEEVERELSGLKQKSAAASEDLPEAAELLNQLKTRRKKSSATLADIEAILEMIEES